MFSKYLRLRFRSSLSLNYRMAILRKNSLMNGHYRLQRSCEGYVFTPVCHSVHRGVYLSACWDTIPPGPGTHSGPVTPSPGPAPPPPQQTATVADGMQPTGMHSCLMTVLSPNCHSAVQTQTQTEPEV